VTQQSYDRLAMARAQCCICETGDAPVVGRGRDFEYNPDSEEFSARRCPTCGLVYLDPRPAITEFEKIYPANYHAFDFSEEKFGFVYKIRSKLEAQRFLECCKGLSDGAFIVDVGCGDGFHLNLLRQYGNKSWTLEGIDLDKRAIEMAEKRGFVVHQGTVESIDLPSNRYDLAFMIQTIEHVEKPVEVLRGIRRILKPGGRLVIVTDNTGSVDFGLFKKRYWGGYHFPRHWNLFNRNSMRKLAEKTNFDVVRLRTIVSPVNWVYTVHNWLVGKNAPNWLINQFSLSSTLSLGFFTIVDFVLQKFGRGALLQTMLRKPAD